MKKLIAMLLTLMMLLSLAACGESQQQNENTETAAQVNQTSESSSSTDIDTVKSLLCINDWGDWYYENSDNKDSAQLMFYSFHEDGTIISHTYNVMSYNTATHKFTNEGVYTINSDGTITTEIKDGGKPSFSFTIDGQKMRVYKKDQTPYRIDGDDPRSDTELYNDEWLEKIWGNELSSSSTKDSLAYMEENYADYCRTKDK